MSTKVLLWVGFHLFVVAMLVIDLGIVRRVPRAVTTREAMTWTAIWIGLSLAWGGGIFLGFGPVRGTEFFTGYVVEYALSVDNLFVFLMLFAYFRVPPQMQHRLLFWGILGEFAMRAPLILIGTQVVRNFHAVVYVFGAFLVYTAVKTAFAGGDEADPEKGWVVRLARRVLPLAKEGDSSRFAVREDGQLRFTRLTLVLVVLNVTDLFFALDSIPAVLGVTRDPFVAYASNVCAIFGLRSLFSVVSSLMDRLRFLKVAVCVILGFVGVKMIASRWAEVPVGWSLAFIAAALVAAMAASALWPGPKHGEAK